MLTDAKIKSLKPQEKAFRVADGGGMYIEVSPKGKKVFRQVYLFQGKSKTHTHGEFPGVKLAHARRLREELKGRLFQGQDPNPGKTVPRAVFPEEAGESHDSDSDSWRSYTSRYMAKR